MTGLRRHLLVCFILFVVACLPRVSQATDAYRVGPGDILQITVQGDTGLSGRFRVSPQGMITYPFLGEVAVLDSSSVAIAAQLRFGLAKQIPVGQSLTAEVAEYAPVFITGDVEHPGQYQFRPGMIVLELVALGGGLKADAKTTDLSSQLLQVLNAEQQVAELRLARASQEATRARILAETAGTELAAIPALDTEPISAAARQRIVEDEGAVFRVRKEVLNDRRKSLDDQRESYLQEIAVLQESIKLHDQEVELLSKEADTTVGLVDKGLAPQPRAWAIKRDLSATKRDALELQSFLARARQHQLDVEMQIRELYNVRANENATELRSIDIDILNTEQRTATALNLLLKLRSDVAEPSFLERSAPTYAVLRIDQGRYHQHLLAENDPIMPRDLVKVEREVKTREARF